MALDWTTVRFLVLVVGISVWLVVTCVAGPVPTNVTSNSTDFKCPPKDFVAPCKCFTWDSDETEGAIEVEISCRTPNVNETFLRDLFFNLSEYAIKNNFTTEFESLRLESTAVTRLDQQLFFGISFRQLDIFNNLELTEFSLDSFVQSTFRLETLCIQGSELNNQTTSIFQDLQSFYKLNTIILSNTGLLGLPEETFGRTEMPDLSYLDLSSNKINEVGRRSFYKLPDVHRINLDHNQISYLYNDSFLFEREDSKLMLLFLRHNLLNSSSFEPGIFGNIDKTTFVYLNHNNLTHLPEEVFRPALELKTDLFIALWNNPFECDCRSKWLLNNVEYFKKRVHGLKCPDRREIWDYSFEELKCDTSQIVSS